MKAAVVENAHTKWKVKDVPTPKPGTNQVLIKMRASGICYTDVHQTNGDLSGPFPRILGHEPVGDIVKVGRGADARKVGDRVGVPWAQKGCGRCEWCERGKMLFCEKQQGTSGEMNGGHAEYMVAYADATELIPEGVSFEQAAPVFCAGYTVWSGLRWAKPSPGERVAVVGIGGLGHLALQYAKAAGFRVIAVSHSPDKDALMRELGVDEIVRNGEELSRAGGADVILGTSNSMDAMADSIKGLRPDGRFILMGFQNKPFQIHPADLLFKRAHVIGSLQNDREYLYEALDFVARGKVEVKTELYSFSEINKAYDRVAEGKVRFRAVVTM